MSSFEVLYSEPIDEVSDAQVGIAHHFKGENKLAVRYRYDDVNGHTARSSATFPVGVLSNLVQAYVAYRES